MHAILLELHMLRITMGPITTYGHNFVCHIVFCPNRAFIRPGMFHQQIPANSNNGENGLVSKSPDINPIEHAGDILKTAIYARPVQLTTIPELQPALLDKRARIPEESIRRFLNSMRMRCRAVIQSNVRHTRY